MIIGITGPICSGKSTLVKILEEKYGNHDNFQVINLYERFYQKIKQMQEAGGEGEGEERPTTPELKPKTTEESKNSDDSGPDSYYGSPAAKDEEEEVKGELSIEPTMMLPIDVGAGEEDQSKFPSTFYQQSSQRILNDVISEVATQVKQDWMKISVIYPVPDPHYLLGKVNRNYCMIYELKAKTGCRYKRYLAKYNQQQDDVSLEDFIEQDDHIQYEQIYKTSSGVAEIKKTFLNKGTLDEFKQQVSKFEFDNIELYRPKWDTYFLQIAEIISQRSNCMKRAVGAIIVANDWQIVSTGYNGTPFNMKNCNLGGCERCNSNAKQGTKLDQCRCIHAEENAVIVAGMAKCKEGKGATIYVSTYPCSICAKAIIQSGIKRVVYYKEYNSPLSKKMFEEVGMELVQHSPYVT